MSNPHIVSASKNQKNKIVYIKGGSTVTPAGTLGNSSLIVNKNTQISLQETQEWSRVNSLSQVPTNLLVGGQNFLEFDLSKLGHIKHLMLELTLKNTNTTAAATQVWEAPVMPFAIRQVDLFQDGVRVGQTIVPMQIYLHEVLTKTTRQLKNTQSDTGIDATTLNCYSSANIAYNGVSKKYAIDLAPFIPTVQAGLCHKYIKPCRLRVQFEDIAKIAPSDTNGSNAYIQSTVCQLLVCEKLVDSEAERKIVGAMQSPTGYTSRVVQFKYDDNSAFVATASQNVPYQSRVWNGESVLAMFAMLRNSTQTGANISSTFYEANNMYVTDLQNNMIDGPNQKTGADLILEYKNTFEENDYIHESNKFLYPIYIGSTNPVESLKTGKNLGYKVINEFNLNVNAAASATRDLLIAAFIYSELNVKNGLVTVA